MIQDEPTDPALIALLDGNRAHTDALSNRYFDGVRDAQNPSVVSMCCSDSRVSQEGMWDVTEPGWLFTPSNIGNQAWDICGGERVVNGNLLYPVTHAGTRTVAIVGHTGCGAITAAYRTAIGEADDEPPGIEKWVAALVPIVEDGLDCVDRTGSDSEIVNRLVEYNVDRQVAFLRSDDDVPADVHVYGFVYDFQRVYGDVPGRAYLVNDDGETDPVSIAEGVPNEYERFVRRL